MNLFDSSQHCDATLAKAKTMTRVSAIQHQPKSKNAATMNSATLGRSKMTVSLGVPFIITVRRVVIMSIWIGWFLPGGRVSVKRGCSSSVSASSSSFGGGSASAWSQSCSSDLCNSNDGRTISFSMPDMNAFNVFKGFNGDSQAAFSNRKSNAASGSLYCSLEWVWLWLIQYNLRLVFRFRKHKPSLFDGFYRCFGGDIELHNAKLGRSWAALHTSVIFMCHIYLSIGNTILNI